MNNRSHRHQRRCAHDRRGGDEQRTKAGKKTATDYLHFQTPGAAGVPLGLPVNALNAVPPPVEVSDSVFAACTAAIACPGAACCAVALALALSCSSTSPGVQRRSDWKLVASASLRVVSSHFTTRAALGTPASLAISDISPTVATKSLIPIASADF